MPMRWSAPLGRCALASVLVLAVAGCTPGGQFDPTVLFATDMFDTKTKLKGDREPVFPNGVPGTENGIPPDLVKGYQPPPDQTADTTPAPAPAPTAQAAPAEKPKPKPKPKPKVARAPATPAAAQDPAFNQPVEQIGGPAAPTRISIGPKPAAPAQSASPQQSSAPSQSIWPSPTSTAPSQQQPQSIWPNPTSTSVPSQ